MKVMEIPVYSMRKSLFDNRWNKWIEKESSAWGQTGWDKQKAYAQLRKLYYPKPVWEYSQIVGYIIIEISCNDVWFEAYMPINHRFRYDSTHRGIPQNLHMNGTHFQIKSDMTNDGIVQEMRVYLDMIARDHIGMSHYIDLTAFNSIVPYIDFLGIISSLREVTV